MDLIGQEVGMLEAKQFRYPGENEVRKSEEGDDALEDKDGVADG